MKTTGVWISILVTSLALMTTACKKEEPFEAIPVDASQALSAEDCRSEIEIIDQLPQYTVAQGQYTSVKVKLTNKGKKPWYGEGKNQVFVGLLWFPANYQGTNHSDSLGQQWTGKLPQVLMPGESTVIDTQVGPQGTGEFQVWLGVVQPSTMWCWHVNGMPEIEKLKVKVNP